MRAAIALLLCLSAWAQERPKLNLLRVAVAFQCVANAADIVSSWHQPEGTAWLANSGRFESKGLGIKIGLSAGISVASFLIARKWRTSRPLVAALNGGIAVGFGSQAARNFAVNPRW